MHIMNPRIIIEPTNWFQKFLKNAYVIKFAAATERESETTRYAVTNNFITKYYKEEELNQQSIENFIKDVKARIEGNIKITIYDSTGIFEGDMFQ